MKTKKERESLLEQAQARLNMAQDNIAKAAEFVEAAGFSSHSSDSYVVGVTKFIDDVFQDIESLKDQEPDAK